MDNASKKYLFFFFSGLIFPILVFSYIGASKYGMNFFELLVYEKREWIRSGIIKENLKADTIKIAVIGDSVTASGFRPVIFDRLSGNKTFTVNLSQISTGMGRFYYILQDFVVNNYIPDYIVLHPMLERAYKFPQNGSKEEINFYTWDSQNSNISIALRHYIPAFNVGFFRLLHFMKNYSCGNRCNEEELQNVREMFAERGAYWFYTNISPLPDNFKLKGDHSELPIGYDPKFDDKASKDSFVKFLDYTKKLKIKVILKLPPLRIGKAKMTIEPPRYYQGLTENYDNVLVFLWKEDFYPPRNFFDHMHLNRDGAEKYTKDLYGKVEKLIGIKE
jgi:hypothetical protein